MNHAILPQQKVHRLLNNEIQKPFCRDTEKLNKKVSSTINERFVLWYVVLHRSFLISENLNGLPYNRDACAMYFKF